jgi:transposase-like protein
MADTADRILDDLRRRRDELRPLVTELERIEAAIDALERASATGNSTTAATAPRRRRFRRGDPNRTDQFLALVREGGTSISAAAQELGIGPNYLYRIANTLQDEGTIRKEGREYFMNVDGESTENADVVEPPTEQGDDDDLVTDEGVNEGTQEIATE